MGLCISNPTKAPLTAECKTFTGDQVTTLLKTQLKLTATDKLIVSDRTFTAYPLAILQQFLKFDVTDKLKYKAEAFDCDDFARVLVGEEKKWYQSWGTDGGSTFGIVHGDIRKLPTDTTPRPHALNVFIDSNEIVHIIEPQSDEITDLNQASDCWLIIM